MIKQLKCLIEGHRYIRVIFYSANLLNRTCDKIESNILQCVICNKRKYIKKEIVNEQI